MSLLVLWYSDSAWLMCSIEAVDKQPGQYPKVTVQISIKPKGDFTKPNKKVPKGRKAQQIYYNLSILTLRSDGYLIDSRRMPYVLHVDVADDKGQEAHGLPLYFHRRN